MSRYQCLRAGALVRDALTFGALAALWFDKVRS